MKKKFIFISLLIFLFTLLIFFSSLSYAQIVSCDLSNSIFRLHIIANSDSKEDQELKLKVRDKIVEYMNTIIPKDSDKNSVVSVAQNHLDDFKEIAIETIKENGYDYPVNVNIGNYYFPTKSYGDISFPAGNYDGLKIEIGNSAGQNWWCVLFPPLCFVTPTNGVVPEESKNNLKENINSEEYELINSSNSSISSVSSVSEDNSIKLKFKLVELFNKQ